MNLDEFDFELPPDRIATHPAHPRDSARLLVMARVSGALRHTRFDHILGDLRPGDCLVVNDSKVIPARLKGLRSGGGRAEALLIAPDSRGGWQAMVKPARKIRRGDQIALTPRTDGAEAWLVIEEEGSEGSRRVRVETSLAEASFLNIFGHVPLPPYIVAARKANESRDFGAPAADPDDRELEDREDYQTVYADAPGSVAAPTAGLHFTPALLDRIRAAGIEIRRVTLHVGPGTFAPVKTENVEGHVMHSERYEIDAAEAEAIEAARRDPSRRIVAVGTTATRTLEACVRRHGSIVPAGEETDLMIAPGFQFQAIDALITNFHLPRSTLLMLVSAFAGREHVLRAYAEAIREGYRFYSYGDAMLIA